ncbi:phage baseplate protein [Pannonibacter sp. SL95]|uniref:phage baseplate protein n=1 Tax=Pannonibacter sp. SL95 TaxID=2995153 RepID=UPI002273D690|nr:phage baseplate protein [Pannonibacter sp. SL95]MCY1705484.1 phage baseplate protein [Pannonibacter sp. SL95]
MRDPYALALRRQAAAMATIERRLAMADLTGKVHEVDPAKRRLRLKLGQDAKGRPVLSPWVRWQEPGVGALSIHSEPAIGEQMRLVSGSGTIGTASIAVPATFDRDHPAPSTASDTTVIARGDVRIEISDKIRLVGPVKIDGAVDIEGSHVTHNGVDTGYLHKHKDITPGPMLTGPPA